jgi:hypothetical protein
MFYKILSVIHSSWASYQSLCIYDIYLVHMHTIGVPEGVTLLEFEEPSEEQQQSTLEILEVQPSGKVPDEVIVECLDHRPCNFVKGKPRSILSLLISEMQLKYYCYIYCCIKFRCWMKTLVALVIQSLSRYWYPESYVAQAHVLLSPA